jgi:methylated-DNA-[protein]-cysteine S-methyltransferase
MDVISGSCRFGLWHVHVWWSGNRVARIRFSTAPIPGPVPPAVLRYLAGRTRTLSPLTSFAAEGDSLYPRIYRAVQAIPYGTKATYGEIAARAGTIPRVVGQAMRRNPTPLIIPCHRVVAKSGPGGFTPSIEIKEALHSLERRNAE